jgi:translation initiation factor IF-3
MEEKFSTEVIVLESDGEMIGKMHFRSAQTLAHERGLDLIQVATQNKTSICKIMDRGKWLYDQKKKKSKNKRSIHQLKEMQFGMRIDDHDQQTKINHIMRFLEKGHDVRVVVEMHGRERSHPDLAAKKLDQILNELNCDVILNSSRQNSKCVSVLIKPKKDDGNANQISNEST